MLLIDKPVDISSFGVVATVRRATGVKKVGHAGTLDPLASGLMLILIGRDETKRAGELLGLDKTYIATVRIGESRTTGDLEGEVLESKDMADVARVTIENGLKQALKEMQGTLQLPVPAYSAIKQDGQRLYKKARKGQDIDLPIRDMHVYKAELLDVARVTLNKQDNYDTRVVYDVRVMFYVKSGVYIRSLAEELGKRLGHPATLAALRRINIGKYTIENSQSLDSIKSRAELISHKIDV
jgi:tRNA pseudouridine55 synthase